jgi:5-methylcytosine-specific restriction protein A
VALRSLTFCTWPGCKRLTRARHCGEHARAAWREESDGKRHTEDQEFYNSQAWRKLAQSWRRRNPLCVNFETCGGVAELVDHIVPIRLGGGREDPTNLQSMCGRCHNLKRAEERKQHET